MSKRNGPDTMSLEYILCRPIDVMLAETSEHADEVVESNLVVSDVGATMQQENAPGSQQYLKAALEMLKDAAPYMDGVEGGVYVSQLPTTATDNTLLSPLAMHHLQAPSAGAVVEGRVRKQRKPRATPYDRVVAAVDVDSAFPKTTREFFQAKAAKLAQKAANRVKIAKGLMTDHDPAKMTATERKHAENATKGIFVVQTRGKNKDARGVSLQIVITREMLVDLQLLEIQAQADMLGISHSAVKTARKLLGIKQRNLRSTKWRISPTTRSRVASPTTIVRSDRT